MSDTLTILAAEEYPEMGLFIESLIRTITTRTLNTTTR